MTQKQTLLYPFSLFLIVFLFYGSTFNAGLLTIDDTQTVFCAANYSPWQYFFIPESYHCLSAVNLTPWIIFSFEADVNLFGLETIGFRLHHLLSLSFTALASFFFMRLWLTPLWSFLGVILFLLAPPTWMIAQGLFLRHYLEGLLFSLISLSLFVIALRKENQKIAWIGSLSYLLALTAKEIYAPLILILFFMPESHFKQRLKYAISYIIIALVYLPWRFYLLGAAVGGYTGHFLSENVFKTFSRLPDVYALIMGNHPISYIVSLTIILLLINLIFFRKINALLVIISALIIFIPIFPVLYLIGADVQHLRLFFVVGWAASYFTAFVLDRCAASLQKPQLIFVVYLSLAGVLLYQTGAYRQKILPTLAEIKAHETFLLTENNKKIIFVSPTAPAMIESEFLPRLAHLKKLITQQYPPELAFDEIHLARFETTAKETWTYSPRCFCLINITEYVAPRLADWRSKIIEKPLFIEITGIGEGTLAESNYKMGPYTDGKYYLVDKSFKTALTFQKDYITNKPTEFYLRYDSPAGWISYSPVLNLVPQPGAKLIWQRSPEDRLTDSNF